MTVTATRARAERRRGWVEAVSLGDALLRTAAAQPDRDSVVTPEGRWSYGQLAARAERIARSLLGMGVQRGDHIGVLIPNGFECLATYFGVALAGAAIVPINARYRSREVGYLVENADLVAIITSDSNDDYADYLELISSAVGGVAPETDPLNLELEAAPRLRSIIVLGSRRQGGVVDEERFDEFAVAVSDDQFERRRAGIGLRDRAIVLYTSGTTAQPRGCLVSHEAIVRVWGAVARDLRLEADDRVWNPCPMFHIAAMGVSIACVLEGAAIVTARFFEPTVSLDLLERECPTALYPAYPQILLGILHHPRFGEVDMSFAKRFLVVGPPQLLRQLQEALPHAVLVSTFGMTESCGCATGSQLDDPLDARCGTSGLPLGGLELRIADPETGVPLDADMPGEIQLRGPLIFDGYYRDAEKTAATILPDGWMRTGDLGSTDSDGRLQFRGRIKEMLKVGGENVAPAELEAHLMSHPAVHLAQVVGIPDARLDEVPVAFVELNPGAQASEAELLAYCEGAIARFKIPRHVRFTKEWPMSATKVQKSKLRAAILEELGLEDRSD